MCCQGSVDTTLIEEFIDNLLETLKIRKLSISQFKIKLRVIFDDANIMNNKEQIRKKLLSILIDDNDSNQGKEFQEKFSYEIFDKTELIKKNINIYLYPILKDKEISDESFYDLCKEKYGDMFNYEQFYKELLHVITFYTRDINKFLLEFLSDQYEKDLITQMNNEHFSKENIELFVNKFIPKEDMIKNKSWTERVAPFKTEAIFKGIGIDNFKNIRQNLINFH